jgi:rSAM/selenodomain-associated transferase 1
MKNVLAVFAKTPLPGLVKTRLAPGLSPEEGAELYRCMLLDTVARARTLPVDIVIFFDGDERIFRDLLPGVALIRQHEGGLGERLQGAFAELSSLGYRARVVIGTDAPDLPLGFIQEAFRLIEAGSDAVFGPAEDGGYYLVALGGATGGLFRDIPWSGPQVLAVSRERASEAGFTTALLPTWYDVDSFADLQRPGLRDPENGAPLTRGFLRDRGIGDQHADGLQLAR